MAATKGRDDWLSKPQDYANSPKVTSGLCLGTPALTTRGLKENDIAKVADFLDRAIVSKSDSAALAKIRQEVAEFCKAFPMPH